MIAGDAGNGMLTCDHPVFFRPLSSGFLPVRNVTWIEDTVQLDRVLKDCLSVRVQVADWTG